jgi:hypothetical protein
MAARAEGIADAAARPRLTPSTSGLAATGYGALRKLLRAYGTLSIICASSVRV